MEPLDLDQILEQAVTQGASDIHLTVDKPPFFRINGRLQAAGSAINRNELAHILMQVLGSVEQEKIETTRDLDFVYTTRRQTRFRGNAYYTRQGLAIAFRRIPQLIPSFPDLGLPEFVLDIASKLNKGLVLVVGPTGHGKSTTLASLIKARADSQSQHFILLEDPVEFLIESSSSLIHQRTLNHDFISFSQGIKSSLREDPDTLMVGEMRDPETIAAALTAAETGHTVFSTLHTNGAAETIHRIIDAFPENRQTQIQAQLASTLKMVIAQRLIESTDGYRVLAYEILTSSYAISNHIRQNTIHHIPNAMQTDGSGRMILFDQCLAHLVKTDKVAYETAEMYSPHPDQLKSILEIAEQ